MTRSQNRSARNSGIKERETGKSSNRNTVLGAIVGLVAGIVIGATQVAPILPKPKSATEAEAPELDPAPLVRPGEPADLRWSFTGPYPSGLPQLGTMATRFAREVRRISEGRMDFRYAQPDSLIPKREVLDAVKRGKLPAAFVLPGDWAEQAPMLELYSGVPFGPSMTEFLAWMRFGNGDELLRAEFAKFNSHALICGVGTPEASGWFRRRIVTPEDLDGLTMGFSGLGAKVMSKLGVTTRALNGADIFSALEGGTIDATEFATPSIDRQLRFFELAPHYYLPGWHQQAALVVLLVNLDQWNGLTDTQHAWIETACGDTVQASLIEGEAAQVEALLGLRKEGAMVHKWSPELLSAFRAAWDEVVADRTKTDEDFAKAWQSLKSFRKSYALWREMGHL